MAKRFRQWSASLSWQHRSFLFAQIVIAIFVLYLWWHLPLPGWSVAILAGVAAAMSIHGDMRGWQKAIWMVLIGLLLVIELRTISKDRADSDRKALSDRAEQDKNFKNIRTAQDDDFRHTADGLKAAIDGIGSTLKSANRTLEQTRPHAVLHFTGVDFKNPPTPPAPFQAGVQYHFNCDFINDGNEDATFLESLMKIYIAKPDDKNAQLNLAAQFEQDWNVERQGRPSVISAHHPGFDSILRALTSDEVERLRKGDTIYLLRRLEYTDSTGKWFSDDCSHLQVSNKEISFGVGHPCIVFSRDRYRPPRRSSR